MAKEGQFSGERERERDRRNTLQQRRKRQREKKIKERGGHRTKQEFRLKFRNVRPRMRRQRERGMRKKGMNGCFGVYYTRAVHNDAIGILLRYVIRPAT